MSTRCFIGKVEDGGKVRGIYCHHDGYLEGVGQLLDDTHNSYAAVNAILELGDLSSLGDRLDRDGGTVAYGRDRGETGTEAQEWDSLVTFEAGYLSEYVYLYLFRGGRWLVSAYSSDVPIVWRDLGEALKEAPVEIPKDNGALIVGHCGFMFERNDGEMVDCKFFEPVEGKGRAFAKNPDTYCRHLHDCRCRCEPAVVERLKSLLGV